ncbi:uncharacterized protein LOC118437205 [Folsomia candida]|uniref:uncharacterized protein LOC118437205 n=1 Tax=Folsomia candida TaxID=158441 RepID=UPI001604F17E|nr:uncharacterized protein LOC118437205 [Folsomia candida]
MNKKFAAVSLLILVLASGVQNEVPYRRHFLLKHLSSGKCLVGHRGDTFMDFCDPSDKIQEWITLGPQWGGSIRPFITPEMCLASPPEGKGFYTHLQNCSLQCACIRWTITLDPRPTPAPSLGKVMVWNNDVERCLQPSGVKVKTGPCPKHDGWIKIERAMSDSFFWEMALIKATH